VLLLMSSATYRARAFLDAARAAGAAVTVGSERALVLGGAGVIELPFDQPAAAAVAAATVHARRPFAAVLACEDEGLAAAAAIAAALGLAGSPPAAVARARDKRLMRAAFADAGLPSPWFEAWPAATDAAVPARRVRYPCVLKPPALSASRGVVRADDPAEFIAAFATVRHVLEDAGVTGADAEVLVEEYLPGDEIAVEGLLTGGALRVLAVFDKPDPLTGPAFEETIYVTPSRHDAARLAAAERVVAAMAAALGLVHGPVHAEVRLDTRGAWPLEIAPRSIGGLCSRALRFGDGATVDGAALEELLLRHALGDDVSHWGRESAASGVMMVPVPRAGILHGVSGIEQARAVPGIDDVRITVPLGHPVLPAPEGSRYLGFLFARAAMPADAEQALRQAHERLDFDIRTE